MTDPQLGLYRREWNAARQVLRRGGLSPKDADARRHELHVEALGADKSSTDLTNKEFDEVLKAFRAISRPADFAGQMALADMAAERKRHAIRQLMDALELDDAEMERRIARRQHAGRLVTASAEAAVTFETIGVEDLERLLIDLKRDCRRRWPRKGDLLTEIRVLRMSHEFDEAETTKAVREALRWRTLPALERMDYDPLLVVVGTMRRLTANTPF